MSIGKSVRIYLKDGTVSGIKLGEIVNHTIQALASPRNKIIDVNNYFNKEINKPGIYFLIGEDENNESKVYIGEAENVWERLKNHDITKDFWTEVILFSSKDENLTKSHVKYLESRLISLAKIANRYKIENLNSPILNSLPLPDQDAMVDFIKYIKLLSGILGHNFLENPISLNNKTNADEAIKDLNPVNSSENVRLELKIKGIVANAIQTDEGIIVLKNSQVAISSKIFGYGLLREKLIREKIITYNSNGDLQYSVDYLFKSPSAAAAVTVGYNINGRNCWKDEKGRSLNEIEKSQIN